MSSAIKSWIYQPNLAKPTECLLYRQVSEGGLGLYNISCRAKANLIKSFLETACGLKFKVNLFHKAIFDHYVLEDDSPSPGKPPYYNSEFFHLIKEAKHENLDVKTLSLKDWYKRILERDVTHDSNGDNQESFLIESRMEYIYPHIDHRNSWSVLQIKGISPSLRSELYMIKNDLHPSQERLHRFKKAKNGNCLRCNQCDNHGHFLTCPELISILSPLYTALQISMPNISAEKLANLDLPIDNFAIFPVVWILASISQYIWQCKKRNIEVYDVSLHGILTAEIRPLSSIEEYKIHSKFINDCINSLLST